MSTASESKTWIKQVTPDIKPPSLNDNTADCDRLLRGLKKVLKTEHILFDFSLLKNLPDALRHGKYRIRATLFEDAGHWHLVHVSPLEQPMPIYGLAMDLGTSTIVIHLIDLTTRESLEEISFHNPQIEIGPDILTRIHFATQGDGLSKLQSLLTDKINKEVAQLCVKHGISTHGIVGLSAAGNTTMTHLFLGLNPYWICREPYTPVINSPGLIRAKDLDLAVNPWAPVLVFPNVGSYFGGDLIAGIMASGMTQNHQIDLLVDVGTNAEVVIGNRDWLMGCAGAAGPALEGGVAGMGMMAGPGVIDRVEINPQTLDFHIRTIGSHAPIGICGSGLIDLVAQLYLAGMIDVRGKFVQSKCEGRLKEVHGISQLVVVPARDSATGRDLVLSQPDIDALIRSKAAMYTILTTLTQTLNISMNQIGRIYVAGTFGAYIDPLSAITLGMMPDLPLETYAPLGNTSVMGATMALVSAKAKQDIFRIRDQITYLELNVNQEFMNLFSAAKFIPHTDKTLFPTVKSAGT